MLKKLVCHIQPLSVTPRWEFVVHMNSTQVGQMNSTKVVHTNSVQYMCLRCSTQSLK